MHTLTIFIVTTEIIEQKNIIQKQLVVEVEVRSLYQETENNCRNSLKVILWEQPMQCCQQNWSQKQLLHFETRLLVTI